MWWNEDDEVEIVSHRRKSSRISALSENKIEKQKSSHSSASISPSNNSNVKNNNKKDIVHKEGKAVVFSERQQQQPDHACDDNDGGDVPVLPKTKTETLALFSLPPPPGAAKKGRKRKKLGDLAILSKKDGENPNPEDNSAKNDHPETESSKRRMPGRSMLEFVLDILQRKDTNEIFAQPVNPDEVEGYYNIIKEPMDFGTMRAKLQEGMYTSLEQFERDVFLISSNAMHFNASTTIFYREARAIQELSQRVFQVLKSDPENFESNLVFNKRIPVNKSQVEAKVSHSKLAKPGELKIGASPTASNSFKKKGSRNGKKSTQPEMQRRQAYNPTFPTENELLVSSFYNGPKPLVPAEDQDYTYKESNLQFAEGLGPAAQEFARKKLGKFQTDEAPKNRFWTQLSPAMQKQKLLPAPSALLPPVYASPFHNPKGPSTYLREKPRTSNVNALKGLGNLAPPFPGVSNILKTTSQQCNHGGKASANSINAQFSSKTSVLTEMDTTNTTILNLNMLKEKQKLDTNESLNLNMLKGKQVMTGTDSIYFQGNNRGNAIAHQHHCHRYQNDSFRLASHIRVMKIENPIIPGRSKSPRVVGYKAIDMMANANRQLGKQVQQTQKTDLNHRKLIDFMSKSNPYLKSNFFPSPSEASYASQILLTSHAMLATQNFSPPPQDIKFQSVLVHATLSSQADMLPPLTTLDPAQTHPVLDPTPTITWAPQPVVGSFTSLLMQSNKEEDYKLLNNGTSFLLGMKSPCSSAQGLAMPLYPAANSLQESGLSSQLYHDDQHQQSLMESQRPDLALQL